MTMQTLPGANELHLPIADVVCGTVSTGVCTHGAQAEIDRLMGELHMLVSRDERSGLDAIEDALPMAAKLQVVTANLDACNPSRHPGIGVELVGLADRRVRTRRDAIERSLAYTADATMRRLSDG